MVKDFELQEIGIVTIQRPGAVDVTDYDRIDLREGAEASVKTNDEALDQESIERRISPIARAIPDLGDHMQAIVVTPSEGTSVELKVLQIQYVLAAIGGSRRYIGM